MHWFIALSEQPLNLDEIEAAANAELDAIEAASGAKTRQQCTHAITAMRAIAESGAVGPGPYLARLSGMTNPSDAEPNASFENDAITIELRDGRVAIPTRVPTSDDPSVTGEIVES